MLEKHSQERNGQSQLEMKQRHHVKPGTLKLLEKTGEHSNIGLGNFFFFFGFVSQSGGNKSKMEMTV
jgi:hypothetical protein